MSELKQVDNRDKLKEDLAHYRQVMDFLSANVPIEVLCLPKAIENVLLADGCSRVYDLIGRDLTEIKGLGRTRVAQLTSRLDEFLFVGI